jgi:CRISPR system Cascade subunit CasA
MTASFNLAEQPWIPCERPNGSTVERSTRDALTSAHELRGIADESPLVVAVLHRHLLAILHRSYAGPRTMKEWAEIARAGRFDVARVEAYLSRVHGRMDLLHPTHPFAQTRGLVERGMPVKAIDELEIERSGWGQARELFQHRPKGFAPTMPVARAARLVLAHHAFAQHGTLMNPAEGKRFGESHSASAGPLVHCAVVFLRGENLFATLLANLLCYDPDMSRPVATMGEDRPSWEQDPFPARLADSKESKRAPHGWLDSLTWLSRRIELVANEMVVSGFARGIGQGLAEEPFFADPMVTYRRDPKVGLIPIRINFERAFWRDANALFEATREDSPRDSPSYQRPAALDQVGSAAARAHLPPETVFSVDMLGMHAKSGIKWQVHTVRQESLTVKARLLSDPDARETVTEATRLSEQAVGTLMAALRTYAETLLPAGDPRRQREHADKLVRSLGAETAAWSALGVEFDVFLRKLGTDMAQAREHFGRRLRLIIEERFRDAVSRSDAAGRGLQARAVAERRLQEALSSLAPPDVGSRATLGHATNQEASHV